MQKTTLFTALLLLISLGSPVFAQELDLGADDRSRRVVKILRTTNKAQVNQFVPVAFDFKNVNPHAVARFIRRPIESEEGNWWTFIHPDGDKGRLLINVPIWMVDSMSDLMSVLDRPQLTSSDGSHRSYYKLKHRDPRDSGFRAAISANQTVNGFTVPDAATGVIYVQDTPSGGEAAMLKITEEMDVPTEQIMLRMKVYEIDLSNDGTIGLDYMSWKNGPGRNLFAFQYFNEYFKTSRNGVNGGLDGNAFNVIESGVDNFGMPGRRLKNDGYNVAYFYDVPSAYFDFLVTKGKARIVTAPRTTVMDAETAFFSTGEEILFYRVQNGPSDLAGIRPESLPLDPNGDDADFPDNRTLTGELRPRVVPDVVESGLELQITPIIGEETITLEVDAALVSQLGFDDTGAPVISSRTVSSVFQAQPGAEYILGGMTRTRGIQTTQKIPFLGSIPIFGYLFGGETTVAKKTLVVMVVSAVPITDYSGMGAVEQSVIGSVDTIGMDTVPLTKQLIGFDQLLMGDKAE